ncbi:hypothetical protein NUM3379_35920 [Kineococcus sp. NUM-3379]
MRYTVRAATALMATVAVGVLAAPAQADPRVGGEIGVRYEALGGERGLLGAPRTPEIRTPNGKGAYVVFDRGSIYWSPQSGAHEVHGAIRDAYAWGGWENGYLGFPTTDEVRTPNGRGAYNVFQGGSVYWSPATGAHAVRGAIRDTWGAHGWEGGTLGFPTSSEFNIRGGKRTNFQNGFIEWTPRAGTTIVGNSGVAGCPSPFNRATPEQAAGCTVRGWELRRGDVLATYATNAVAGELLATPYTRATADGCSRPARPTTTGTSGIECVYFLPPRAGDPTGEGVEAHLGIGVHDGYGAVVEDVVFIG